MYFDQLLQQIGLKPEVFDIDVKPISELGLSKPAQQQPAATIARPAKVVNLNEYRFSRRMNQDFAVRK